jgi:hypothetical protein
MATVFLADIRGRRLIGIEASGFRYSMIEGATGTQTLLRLLPRI